jgi:gamma-tubulin complex component 4
MIAELILLLAGHPSALFLDSGKLDPAFEELLHPGEQQSLEYLSRIAGRYRTLKSSGGSLSGTSEYLSSMMAAVRVVLSEYENLVVQTEAKVLQRDDEIVASGSFVPLASLKATFSQWDGPLAALESLINHIQRLGPTNISPGSLIDLLLERSRVGVERVSEIMADLALAVQRVWQVHLTAYVVHGALSPKDPFAKANPHQLNARMMPNCVSPDSRESIAYVGRAIATVKAARGHRSQQQQLPRSIAVMHTKMLSKVLPQDRHVFDSVMTQIRVNVSEWLWTTVLTRKDVDDALDSL